MKYLVFESMTMIIHQIGANVMIIPQKNLVGTHWTCFICQNANNNIDENMACSNSNCQRGINPYFYFIQNQSKRLSK